MRIPQEQRVQGLVNIIRQLRRWWTEGSISDREAQNALRFLACKGDAFVAALRIVGVGRIHRGNA